MLTLATIMITLCDFREIHTIRLSSYSEWNCETQHTTLTLVHIYNTIHIRQKWHKENTPADPAIQPNNGHPVCTSIKKTRVDKNLANATQNISTDIEQIICDLNDNGDPKVEYYHVSLLTIVIYYKDGTVKSWSYRDPDYYPGDKSMLPHIKRLENLKKLINVKAF